MVKEMVMRLTESKLFITFDGLGSGMGKW